jgi:hypothetical protein
MVNKIILFLKSLNERQLLLLILGITLGLRLYAVLMAKGIAYDSAGYGFMARDFLRHDFIKGLSSPFHPFYPFLISLVSFDPTHVEIAGRLLSLCFGTITLIPLFYLIKEMLGQKEALFSGLFYSIHPYLVTYSGMLLSEATYWCLMTFSIYFFWIGLRRKKGVSLFISGLFLGLAYLTRPEGIGYLLVYLVWIIIYGGLKKGWFKKLVLIGGLVLPIFIIAVPYVVHLHRETGQWLISKKAVWAQAELLNLVEEKKDYPAERVGEGQKPFEKNLKILGIGKNIIQYIPFTTYHYLRAYHFALWLFLFFGLIRARKKGISGELFLASIVLFHLFSLSTFIPSAIRLSVPLIPVTLFWASAGVLGIQRTFQKLEISNPEKWVFFLIIFVMIIQLPQSLRPERRHREYQKRAGLWLKQNTAKDAIIMGNSPVEAFYAEREFIILPSGIYRRGNPGKSYSEIIHFAKEKRVRYILINKNSIERNPDFIESIHPSDLKEFYRYREKGEDRIILFEVVY